MDWSKIQARAAALGGALALAAVSGYAVWDAQGQTFTETITDPQDQLTGPQASCFAVCAQSVWPEILPAGIVGLYAWRIPAKGVYCYADEQLTEDEDVFNALDLGGAVTKACPITKDGADVTFCVKRGPVILDATQRQCLKTCADPLLDGPAQEVDRLELRAGPPRTLDVRRTTEITSGERAAGRADGTIKAP